MFDNEPPVFNVTCPVFLENAELDSCDSNCAIVSWEPPQVYDTLSGSNLELELVPEMIPGSCFTPGTYTAVYVATDMLGNSASCSWSLTVVDQCPAVVTCLVDEEYPTLPGVSYALLNVNDMGSAYDNVGLKYGYPTNFALSAAYEIGTHQFNYEACDDMMGCSSCVISFAVVDREPPVITFCPSDFTVPASPGEATWTAVAGSSSQGLGWEVVTATDNVGVVSITSTAAFGDLLEIGTHVVSVTAQDAAGLTAVCTFEITVVDAEPPVLLCPLPTTSKFFVKATLPGEAYWIADWSVNTKPTPLEVNAQTYTHICTHIEHAHRQIHHHVPVSFPPSARSLSVVSMYSLVLSVWVPQCMLIH